MYTTGRELMQSEMLPIRFVFSAQLLLPLNPCLISKLGQHYAMDRPGVCQVSEGSGKQGKMEETGCEIVCGAPTILAVKG